MSTYLLTNPADQTLQVQTEERSADGQWLIAREPKLLLPGELLAIDIEQGRRRVVVTSAETE